MKQSLLFLLVVGSLFMAGSGAAAQSSSAVSGRVVGYVWNRIGDYDGLRLQTASGQLAVYFPPHAAARVRRVAVVGKVVEADVEAGHPRPVPETNPPTTASYQLVRVRDRTSGAVVQLADVHPPPPQSGKLVQAEGPLTERLLDESGQLVGLLTDKYVIDLKPHQREQISALLTGVGRLGVVGYERPADGFVNRSGRPLIHPTALTISGQTFAL